MKIDSLNTPCLIVDKSKLLNNITRMRDHIISLGARLRPHVKTTKSIELTKLLFDGGSGPITVSTLKEAEFFLKGGFRDILYAVSIVPSKCRRVHDLMRAGAEMKLILDDIMVARSVIDYGIKHQICFDILIEIDSDGHRAGMRPDDPAVMAITRLLHESPGANFLGYLTHAGDSYNCPNISAIKKHAVQERDAVVKCAEAAQEIGITPKIVSMGSTPTATFSEDLTGIDEVRAGVFTFQDLFQANLGVCQTGDIALSVLTTVISHKKDQNRIIIDAGGMALSKDRGTAGQKNDHKFGLVCTVESGEVIDDLIVESANQEHGIITSRSGRDIDFSRYPIGRLLSILPNHACMTAAAHDEYYIYGDKQEILHIWQRCHGW
ncbi:MAG: alanine racemase [Emcibacter sp.]|nr:alanine racemase [Emcibacter sp.]